MNQGEILAKLREIIRDNATEDVDPDQVGLETGIEALGFDSLSILDLLYDVEQVFGLQVEASEVVNKKTVGEIVALLEQRGA